MTSALYLNFIAFAFLSIFFFFFCYSNRTFVVSASKTQTSLSWLAGMIRDESFPSFEMSPSFSFIIRKVSPRNESFWILLWEDEYSLLPCGLDAVSKPCPISLQVLISIESLKSWMLKSYQMQNATSLLEKQKLGKKSIVPQDKNIWKNFVKNYCYHSVELAERSLHSCAESNLETQKGPFISYQIHFIRDQ